MGGVLRDGYNQNTLYTCMKFSKNKSKQKLRTSNTYLRASNLKKKRKRKEIKGGGSRERVSS